MISSASVRRAIVFFEILIVVAAITLTRCANYQDVFVGDQINFIDADCYARMTRARICLEHPGTIVRHHPFENFPLGTSPHTTAPLDYCIVAVAAMLSPLSSHALDLAGAIVSPLISIALGIFLWGWTRRMRLRFRWAILLLYVCSPILTHGFALGRPDHQSLVLALVAVALCAEWTLARESAKGFAILSGLAWALAIWVSPYEPLILLLFLLLLRHGKMFSSDRRFGWFIFVVIIVTAVLIERRMPLASQNGIISGLRNWSSTVGELAHVPVFSHVWFEWCGWLLLLSPLLFWKLRRKTRWFMMAIFGLTYLLTVWHARWGYFFVFLFALLVPDLLESFPRAWLAWTVFILGLFPIAQAWDRALSPEAMARKSEHKIEQFELRKLAQQIDGPFLAPWWLSPALSYWSGQPGVAGSSHEAISGTIDSAKFFATDNAEQARAICLRRGGVKWVVSYDAERLAKNSAAILGSAAPSQPLIEILDRNASNAPSFLRLETQTARFKLFRTQNL